MKQKVKFSLSLLFFWVKGFISVDSRFVKVSKSNTILGVIPTGSGSQSILLKNISSSMISSQYKIKPIILGSIIIFLSFMYDSFLGALIMALIGVGILGSGLQNVLIIQRAGDDQSDSIAVPFFEKAKLLTIQDGITEALAQDTDKTNLNVFFDKKAE
ncbi:hypothetical protein [Enterococcus faecium]|uniref:hypothetical protein n=1 Tax=Enterococcus faecium TaxID=1352 RepID=UPI000BF15C44|nr:hypothetical protein [Enterococcus faecium]PEH49516.1 hypothetical protein CRM75_01810 [Enterococcus faecium]